MKFRPNLSCFVARYKIEEPFGEMSQKPHVLPCLQSVKSLPVDFRLVGSPEPHSLGKVDDVNIGKTEMISDLIPENGELGTGDIGDKIARNDDESPYSSVNMILEEEAFARDQSLNSASAPLHSLIPFRNESKWNDTTYYVGKKVTSSFL